MTTTNKVYMDGRDAALAVRITGAPKFVAMIDETIFHKRAKFFSDMDSEGQLRSMQLSKENPLRQQAAHAEVAMSDELKQLKRQEFLDRKRRQQLRNDCQELRQLADHLRLASITKDLDEHIGEINRSRQLAQNAKAMGFQRAEAERQEMLAREQERELRKKEEAHKLHKILLAQIDDKRQRHQQRYVQKVAEREERMAMQRQIEEEDKMEKLQLEYIKQKKLQETIEFIEQKREYKQLQRAQSNEDIAKVFEKQMEIDKRKTECDVAKKEAQRKHQEISLRIGQQVFEIESRKRQRDNLLLDLLQAEYKAKDDERFRQQLEQEQEERRRARQELERYRAEVSERNLAQARLKQENLSERGMEFSDVHENFDKERKDRQQRKEHGALLLSMIEENQRKRAEAAAENVQFFDMKAKADAELQNIIQNERLQMLSSVPTSVLQYLPKQVLSNSDREYFNIKGNTKASTRPKFM